MAKDKKVKIESYDIIYRLIEDIQKIIKGLIEPEKITVILGKLQVIKPFHKTSDRKLVGGKDIDGKMSVGEKVKILHSGEELGKGKILTVQLEKNKVDSANKGHECGLAISTKATIKSGDIIAVHDWNTEVRPEFIQKIASEQELEMLPEQEELTRFFRKL